MPIKVERIRIAGFRGYVDSCDFQLRDASRIKHLVLLGDNAKGKSSIADAMEFFFSTDGTVARFKQRETQTTAGRRALINDVAETKGLPSEVEVSLFDGHQPVAGSSVRKLVGAPDTPIPPTDNVRNYLLSVKTPLVIRGWELRKFVEDWNPQENYQAVASWLGLTKLSDAIDAVTTIRLELSKIASSSESVNRTAETLRGLLSPGVDLKDDTSIAAAFNTRYLEPLKAPFRFKVLSRKDPAYERLNDARKAEEGRLGITQLRSLVRGIDAVIGVKNEESGEEILSINTTLANASKHIETCKAELESAQRTVTNSYLADALRSARAALTSPLGQSATSCFVCGTEFSKSQATSRETAVRRMDDAITSLERYTNAEREYKRANQLFTTACQTARDSVQALITTLKLLGRDVDAKLLEGVIKRINHATPAACEVLLAAELRTLDEWRRAALTAIKAIESTGGDATYSKGAQAYASIESNLERLKYERIQKAIFEKLSAASIEISTHVSEAVVSHTRAVLTALRDEVLEFYRQVFGENAPELNIALPDEGHRRADKVFIRVDFSPSRKGVLPQGYLSDAGLHTLAMAYRLVAAKQFNTECRFVVLDDVMSSYDAEHRLRLVKALVAFGQDVQLIVLTHNRGFYRYLRSGYGFTKDAALFRVIERYDRNHGPIFADSPSLDDGIEKKLSQGDAAVNDIRQTIEGWVQATCRDFGASARIPPADRPGEYDRSELSRSLGSRIKKLPGYEKELNRTLALLAEGTIANLGSHYQVDENMTPSAGDAKVVWEDFKALRALFSCKKAGCNGTDFYTEQNAAATTKCASCDTTFTFK